MLLIPDLLPPRAPQAWQDPYRDLSVPALEALLARAEIGLGPGASLESFLCAHFGLHSVESVAPYSRVADGVTADYPYWLRADPVYLQAQREQLMLVDGSVLAISIDEAQALAATLNQHFAQDGLSILAAHPSRWYIGLAAAPAIRTFTLAQVAGQGMNACLPTGDDSIWWHQRINEAQMLMHTHPVNAAREARAAPLINSLWVWGGGTAQDLAKKPSEKYWANGALARGLALSADAAQADLPAHAADLLAQRDDYSTHCVVLDDLRAATWYHDLDARRAALQQLDARWIAPLLQAQNEGLISELSVHAMSPQATHHAVLGKTARWRFWRRPHPLSHYAAPKSP